MATCPCGSQSTCEDRVGRPDVRASSSRFARHRHGLLFRLTPGPRRSRFCQQAVRQCLRSSRAMPPGIRRRRPARPRRAACPARSPGRSRGSGRPWRSPRRAPGGPPSRRPATTRRARARARGPAGRSGRGGSGAGSRLPSLGEPEPVELPVVRLVIARCSVDYVGLAHRPPPRGPAPAHRQGGRLGARALRRRLVQAAELDVARAGSPRSRASGR